MAEALYKSTGGIVSLTVFSDGQQIEDTIQVLSVVVSKMINKVSSAVISLYDGGLTEAEVFDASDTGIFDPGKEIEIKAGFESEEETIFKGIVIRHGMKITKDSEFTLSIECKDEAVKTTIGRKNALYQEMSDSDIITEILGNYSNLTPTVDATSYVNPELIQNYSNDWDFIMQRAEINGLAIFNSDNEIEVKKPEYGSAVVEVTAGNDLISFNAYIDARNQIGTVKTASWDREAQEVLSEESSSTPANPYSSLSESDLANVIGLESFNLQTTSSVPSEVLTAWAEAKQIKASFSKVRGKLVIEGYTPLKLGDSIQINGLSEQFNGPLYVGGFEHTIEDGEFTTTVEIGIHPIFYSEEKRDIVSAGASGLLTPMKGLHIGVVEQIQEDDNGEFRIKVKLPTLQVDNLSVWARQANFYATAEAGLFFYPEVNDEVVVGFLNEDPQSPVILGSLYNKNNSVPPYTPEEDNFFKAIVTKTGLKLEFDEENGAITLLTPEEQSIIVNDTDGILTLSDKNDNIIEMSADGIKITSAADIIFDATGDIQLNATGNVAVAATGDFTGEGMNIEMTGSVKFAAEAAMTEVKGSGQTTIEGGIVMIN